MDKQGKISGFSCFQIFHHGSVWKAVEDFGLHNIKFLASKENRKNFYRNGYFSPLPDCKNETAVV